MNFKDHPRQESRLRYQQQLLNLNSMPERPRGNPTHRSSSMALLADVLQITNMLDQTQSTTEWSQPWSTTPSAPTSSSKSETPETSSSMPGNNNNNSHQTSLQLQKSPSAC